LERVVLGGPGLVEPGLVGERRVPVREIDEAALLAALRDDDLHPPPGPPGQPRLERLAFVRLRGDVDLRRRAADFVELLNRGREHFPFARTDNGVFGPELNALDYPAATDLEYLERHAGGSELHAEHVAVAELRGRHLLLPVVQRLHR